MPTTFVSSHTNTHIHNTPSKHKYRPDICSAGRQIFHAVHLRHLEKNIYTASHIFPLLIQE